MKQLFFTITIISSIFVSCSTGNKYEKLIADYVQTDKHGVWTDQSFKLVELEELSPLIVSDSIAILKKQFESDNNSYVF